MLYAGWGWFTRRLTPALIMTVSLGLGRDVVALEQVADFGANPGELDMFVHVPVTLEPGAPVVVALHGCTQSAADFDAGTGLRALADAVPFTLVLPQQRAANNSQSCFNWFEPGDSRRGEGESGSIRSMIATAVQDHEVDAERVFVLGLSAGGSMTAVLMANYPELFAGGAVVAGTPFACNRPTLWTRGWWWWLDTFVGEAASASFACGLFGVTPSDRDGADWARAVAAAAPGEPARLPVVSLWHGDADGTVHPANQTELIEQWTAVHGVDAVADEREAIDGAERERFHDASGRAVVEAWRLPGFGHAMPIDPDCERAPCGIAAPYIEDANLCAVRQIARFWGLSDG